MHKYDVWNAGVARKALRPATRTGNPTLAAAAMLGKRTVARAARRAVGKRGRRAFRGNPLPAVAGLLGGALGGVFGGGAKKQQEREAWADTTMQTGIDALERGDLINAKDALKYLYDMAGLRNPGKFGGGAIGAGTAKAREAIHARYEHLSGLINSTERAQAVQEGKATTAGAAARRAALTGQILESGTTVGAALASALGRSRRRPVRRRRRASY